MSLPLPLSLTRCCRAMVLPAPGRFWTWTLRASLASSIALAAVRAVWSNPPPGAVPTRISSPVTCRLPPPPPPPPPLPPESPQPVAVSANTAAIGTSRAQVRFLITPASSGLAWAYGEKDIPTGGWYRNAAPSFGQPVDHPAQPPREGPWRFSLRT